MPAGELILIAVGVALSLLVRIALVPFESEDFIYFLRPWNHEIRASGFSVLGTPFSDYQPAYLYLLALTSSLPIPAVWAVKLISIAGDLVLAWFTFLSVRVHYPAGAMAPAAGLAMLVVPTVVLNSAAWGQCDVLYTLALVAALLCLLRDRPAWTCLAYGVAMSFKLQAVFFAPVLVLAWLHGRVRLRHLALAPAVFVVMFHPALYLGRPPSSLFGIYAAQTQAYKALQIRAPNPYQWLPDGAYDLVAPLGIAVAVAAVVLLLWMLRRGAWASADRLWVAAAYAFVLVAPLLLPAMHERYFYAADVFSVLYASAYPRRFAVAIVTVMSSLLAYVTYLTWMRPPLPLVAVALVITAALVVYWLLRDAAAAARRAVPS